MATKNVQRQTACIFHDHIRGQNVCFGPRAADDGTRQSRGSDREEQRISCAKQGCVIDGLNGDALVGLDLRDG